VRFRSDPARIRGSIAPVVSPFTADGGTDVIFTETNPATAKWVLARAGLIGSGFVRPPLVPLTGAGQATVLRLLAAGAPVLDGPVAKVAV
jgi:dihydrodipicolinate synthase/N-acetylneuraminate lyase